MILVPFLVFGKASDYIHTYLAPIKRMQVEHVTHTKHSRLIVKVRY